MSAERELCVGQVWQDNDHRMNYQRKIIIRRLDEEYAYVENVVGLRKSRIKRTRFRPNATGYIFLHQERAG